MSNNKQDDNSENKYGPAASKEVKKAMHAHKHKGEFKNKKQAVAVGLNKARKKGSKVPKKKER